MKSNATQLHKSILQILSEKVCMAEIIVQNYRIKKTLIESLTILSHMISYRNLAI